VTGVDAVVLAREFPEMLQHVDEQLHAAAIQRSAAPFLRVRPGAGEPARALGQTRPLLGLLVVVGLLARRVHLGRRACVELLGAGDVLRPWAGADEGSSIEIDTRWVVQEHARIAVLDRRFAQRIAPFPEITGWLLDRAVRRAHWLAFHLAVCSLASLQTRLRVMFWYLADRWGQVTPDGVRVPLELTHSLIGNLVGAHRPATTSALGELAAQGYIERRETGGWLLRGDPPPELDQVRADAHGAAARARG
jgi:CRP-like cAMP-binding protein